MWGYIFAAGSVEEKHGKQPVVSVRAQVQFGKHSETVVSFCLPAGGAEMGPNCDLRFS